MGAFFRKGINMHQSYFHVKMCIFIIMLIRETLHFFILSSDKHYNTSIENSGLDLSLARLGFEKLAKKDKVLLEV